MITKIKEIIFTDKRKDWNDLVTAKGAKFYMLHIRLEDDTWVSKYYTSDSSKEKLLSKLKVWEKYDIQIKEAWLYRNIVSISKWEDIII